MTNIGWQELSADSNGKPSWGETTWVDPRDGEPGVDVSTSFRRQDDGGIEVEVVAYDGDDKSNRVVRRALVSR